MSTILEQQIDSPQTPLIELVPLQVRKYHIDGIVVLNSSFRP